MTIGMRRSADAGTVVGAGAPPLDHYLIFPSIRRYFASAGMAAGRAGSQRVSHPEGGATVPNIQQPEMRRSGQDPLVQDSVETRVSPSRRKAGANAGPVPREQQSPYEPQPPQERRSEDEEGPTSSGQR